MHLALREVTAGFRRIFNAKAVAIWLAASFVATLAGPFETLGMALPARAIYWTFAIGLAIAMSIVIIRRAYDKLTLEPRFLRGVAGALVFAAIYATILTYVGKFVFETSNRFPDLPQMFLYVAPVAVAVTGIVHLFVAEEPPAAASMSAQPRIFKRMKPGLGRSLVRLSMQDHYVETVTEQGSQLILMRFADALDEVEGIEGWRIHRSHWVAGAAIRDVRRDGAKTLLVLSDGAELPVSRTYLPALRDAGVLKRFA